MKRLLFTCLLLLPLLCTNAQEITKMEYFIDTDPGTGNATDVSITAGQDVSANFSIDLTGLLPGVHVVVVRVCQDDSLWSIISAATFITIDPEPQPDIIQMEYYVDADPGYGLGQSLTVTPGKEVEKNFVINLTGLLPGIHQAVVRVKDGENSWSIVASEMFYAYEPVKTSITKMEYFIDSDPGYGNATDVPVASGFDITKTFAINLTGLIPGVHVLSLRSRDANGVWSVNSSAIFMNLDLTVPNTVYLEYFLDTDPGFGNGTPLAITPGQNISTGFVIDTTGWGSSQHDMFLRFRNSKGDWSLTNTLLDNSVPLNLILQGINVSETTPLCYDALQYIYVAGNGASFQVQSGASVTMIAGTGIRIYPATKVFSGGYLHAYISTSAYCPADDAGIITGEEISGFLPEDSFFRIFPNPTLGTFTLEITDGVVSAGMVAEVFSARGEPVTKRELNHSKRMEFSLENNPPGLYFVRVIRDNTAMTKKIIRK